MNGIETSTCMGASPAESLACVSGWIGMHFGLYLLVLAGVVMYSKQHV